MATASLDENRPTNDLFEDASECMRNAKGLRLSSEQKLSVYALFKQVSSRYTFIKNSD